MHMTMRLRVVNKIIFISAFLLTIKIKNKYWHEIFKNIFFLFFLWMKENKENIVLFNL